jgi:hypothetical protein
LACTTSSATSYHCSVQSRRACWQTDCCCLQAIHAAFFLCCFSVLIFFSACHLRQCQAANTLCSFSLPSLCCSSRLLRLCLSNFLHTGCVSLASAAGRTKLGCSPGARGVAAAFCVGFEACTGVALFLWSGVPPGRRTFLLPCSNTS